MTRRTLLYLAGTAFLAVIFCAVGMGWFLVRPAAPGGATAQVFVVPQGAGLSRVAAELHGEGLISSPGMFVLWGRMLGHSRSIKAGEYSLCASMQPVRIMEALRRGLILTHPVTIPEGVDIRAVGRLLSERGLVDEEEFIAYVSDPEVSERYGIETPGLEGFLYPDTYRFSRGLPARVIADFMVERFFDVMDSLEGRIRGAGLSLEQVVILASIIEKETGSAAERPIIASVFFNRMKTGMRLQSDPTAVYDMDDFQGRITRAELRRKSPYNTYVISGLPVGPIGNPGKDAILAVLEPEDTDFFYFVSRNDGTHHFSRTLEEHNAAVRKYQRRPAGRAS